MLVEPPNQCVGPTAGQCATLNIHTHYLALTDHNSLKLVV